MLQERFANVGKPLRRMGTAAGVATGVGAVVMVMAFISAYVFKRIRFCSGNSRWRTDTAGGGGAGGAEGGRGGGGGPRAARGGEGSRYREENAQADRR